jgi:hypothetical protein
VTAVLLLPVTVAVNDCEWLTIIVAGAAGVIVTATGVGALLEPPPPQEVSRERAARHKAALVRMNAPGKNWETFLILAAEGEF